MELRHLRYFVAVAEELHFGRAAHRLHMTQQPLSRQISNLEAELNVQLFHRTKRTISLTEAGESFLQAARKILAQTEGAITAARRVSRGETKQLQLGFTGPILNRVFPKLIGQLKHRFPEINLGLRRLPTNEQVKALLNETIHIGLLHPPINAPCLMQEPLYREPLIAVLPDNHPLAADAPQPISVKSLCDNVLILFPRRIGPALYDSIISFCQQAGFSPLVIQEAFPQQTILGLVAAGLGVSLIHASVRCIQQRGVVTRPLIEETPYLESAIAWYPQTNHPALPHLLNLVRELSFPKENNGRS